MKNKKSQNSSGILDSDNVLKVDSKNLRDILGNPSDSQELADRLLKISDYPYKQRVLQEVLGNLVEDYYGTDEITTSNQLNEYLQRIKAKNFPYLDKARKTINPNMKDVTAGLTYDTYGNGRFVYGRGVDSPDYKNPVITLGGYAPRGVNISHPYTKGILVHELIHANGNVVRMLHRALNSPEDSVRKQAEKIIDMVGSDDLSNQVNNLILKNKTNDVDQLTPIKAAEYQKLFESMPDYPEKQTHIDFLKKYKDLVTKSKDNIYLLPFDQDYIAKTFNTGLKSIPVVDGEGIQHTFSGPIVNEKLNEAIKHPINREIFRSSDHESRYKDIPDDVGSIEIRNIKRLLSKLPMRSVTPLLKTAGKIGVPLAGAYSSYSEAKEEGLPAPLAMVYAGAEELNPTPISGIDFYKGIEKSGKGRVKNIESNYMPEELKVENKALKAYENSPAAKDRAFKRVRDLLRSK